MENKSLPYDCIWDNQTPSYYRKFPPECYGVLRFKKKKKSLINGKSDMLLSLKTVCLYLTTLKPQVWS